MEPSRKATTIPPLVALEEHYLSAEYLASDSYRELYGFHAARIKGLTQKLGDLSPASRITNGISLQVLSHGPGLQNIEQCRTANDQAHTAVRENHDRFAAFAVLPVSEPAACAEELRRCVTELGFKGALIDSHTREGKYFIGKEYDVFWWAFQDLDVPCYIHPTWPTKQQVDTDFRDESLFSDAVFSLSTSTWGWHSDVALHVLKLFSTGVFDRFPRLKIVIGHFGEMLPFMLERIDSFCQRFKKDGRTFKEVWNENIWITTSGVWSLNPLATVLRNTAVERIMFSVDYPFAKNEDGQRWMRELMESGMVDEEGVRKVAYGNAERLLGVKVNVDRSE